MRLIASMPSMPARHHVHQHGVESPLLDPLGRRLAAAMNSGLMAQFAQDGVEHDAAERIVLDPRMRSGRDRFHCAAVALAGA